jgi:hypothetical protein
MTAPHWLPEIIPFGDYGGDWNRYLEVVYDCFRRDFKERSRQLTFRGRPVSTRYHPAYENKDYSFWHLIQEGQVEEERTPDFRRCERIGWIRAVIENAGDPSVRVWENERLKDRGPDRRVILWLEEEFLVVLADRRNYWLLVTAYTTDRANRIEKLRKEYEAYKQAGPATLR